MTVEERSTTLASELAKAERTVHPVGQLTLAGDLSLAEAYAVQLAGVAQRADQGDPVVGLKLGFTSREKARQMGVHDVILGVLTGAMDLGGQPRIVRGRLIHPRIEPEVAFRLGPGAAEVDLTDPRVSLLDQVTHVAAAVEVIDSRYRDFRFSLEDVVADNTSAARFAVGTWVPIDEVRHRISSLPVSLRANGEVIAEGNTAAILGNPLATLVAVQRLAAEHGHPLPASAVVLAGAATPAVVMTPGVTYDVEVTGLGGVSVRVEE